MARSRSPILSPITIKDWYTDVSSAVRVGRQVSSSFPVSRGVRQGSVLSPTLFCLLGPNSPGAEQEILRTKRYCVLPCLLFGAETWILNPTLMHKLESFQADLAKPILQLPTFIRNNTALMALQWPSMRARILITKLCFLLNSDLSLSARVFRYLAASDVESLIIYSSPSTSPTTRLLYYQLLTKFRTTPRRKKFSNSTCFY